MKKLILSLVLTAFAFSSFAMQAVVVSTKGKAEVQNAGTWIALKTGDSLDQGSVIQTGFKSEVVLKIKESTVTVAPLSRITLQTLVEREGLNGASGKDETTIFLDTGSLKSNVQKSADRRVGFTVRSPVATASVRGTVFAMTKKYKTVALATTNGKVAFWKNTANSEKVLNNSAEGPVGEAPAGNEPADISEVAPVRAIVVSKGEGAFVSARGGMSAPANTARANSVSIGGGTAPASAVEKPVAPGAGPAAGPEGPGNGGSGGSTAAKGSLIINIGLGD